MNDHAEFDSELRDFARTVGMVPSVQRPSTEQLHRDEEILAWVLSQPREEPEGTGRSLAISPSLHRRRRWAQLLTAAAGLLAAVTIPLGWWASPVSATETPHMLDFETAPSAVIDGGGPDASAVLLDLAEKAEHAAEPIRNGGIQFVSSLNWFLHVTVEDDGTTKAVVYPTARQTWLSPAGSFVGRDRKGAALDLNGQMSTTPSWSLPPESEDILPPGSVDSAVVTGLPRDADGLRAETIEQFAAMNCTSGPALQAWCLYLQTSGLHTVFVVPGDLTATLWRVLAEEPSVAHLGTVTDRLGREAAAIAFPPFPEVGYSRVQVLLIDPDSGALIGEEEITLLDPDLGIDEPTVTMFTAYLERSWVAEVPD